MTYTKWRRRPLDAKAVLEYIEWAGAPSIVDIKYHFGTDSDSVRRACGKLMYHGQIIPLPYGAAQCFIMRPTTKGKPNVPNIRNQSPKAKGVPEPSRDGAPTDGYPSPKARAKKPKAKKPRHDSVSSGIEVKGAPAPRSPYGGRSPFEVT